MWLGRLPLDVTSAEVQRNNGPIVDQMLLTDKRVMRKYCLCINCSLQTLHNLGGYNGDAS